MELFDYLGVGLRNSQKTDVEVGPSSLSAWSGSGKAVFIRSLHG